MKSAAIISVLTLSLMGCGSGSDSSQTGNEPNIQKPFEAYVPANKNISSMTLVDAAGQPLKNASVEIFARVEPELETETQNAFVARSLSSVQGVLSTDENGNIVLNDLAPGTYTLQVSVSGVTVSSIVVITEGNGSGSTTVAAPLVVDGETVTALQNEGGENNAIFASISGVIYDEFGPVPQVQILISGGAETNGAVAVDTTNDDGEYLLILNVSLSKLSAMESATIRIIKTGYIDLEVSFDPTSALAFIGKNFELTPQEDDSNFIVYQENFEQLIEGATCGSWFSQSIVPLSDIQQPEESPEETEPSMMNIAIEEQPAELLQNLWHSHSAGLDVVNSAIDAGYVLLAPDDESEGQLPQPMDQRACWYGKGLSDDVTQGNFLGEMGSPEGELDGGTSEVQNGGAIVSPVLDFTAVTQPLALTFKTWWEIESLNPNGSGYDLLIIEYSLDGGDSWSDLARLNPISDPQTGCIDRSALPFSNRGFNRGPKWLMQEPIDISVLAGQSNAKIRFVFRTKDNLYNGFRGWLIDDVSIVRQMGTFPLYDPVNFPESLIGDLNEECFVDEEICEVCLMM